jgi:8-oxo-dGTP diphosphatase
MSELFSVPRIGVSSVVVKDGKILTGLRKGDHAPGTWSFPGGHLEYREGVAGAVYRETKEETGLEVRMNRVLDVTEDFYRDEKKHYLTLFVLADLISVDQDPVVREPSKCAEWGWFTPAELDKMKLMPCSAAFFAGASLLRKGPEFFSNL